MNCISDREISYERESADSFKMAYREEKLFILRMTTGDRLGSSWQFVEKEINEMLVEKSGGLKESGSHSSDV